jgi:hypothetical protein
MLGNQSGRKQVFPPAFGDLIKYMLTDCIAGAGHLCIPEEKLTKEK